MLYEHSVLEACELEMEAIQTKLFTSFKLYHIPLPKPVCVYGPS